MMDREEPHPKTFKLITEGRKLKSAWTSGSNSIIDAEEWTNTADR
jgi:hypothetical protein